MSPVRLLAALLAAALAAGAAVSVARADGDPASDYLLAQKVFLPYDAKLPRKQAQALTAAVDSANTQGFPVRVALIWDDYDLGSVTMLWKKPRAYANFLGVEISFYFKGRLLVVMPNGIGLYWHRHSTAPGYKLLAPISVAPTPTGLAVAATAAVKRLAAASGVAVSTAAKGAAAKPPPNERSAAHDRIVIAVAVLLALAVGAAARLLVRRRAARIS